MYIIWCNIWIISYENIVYRIYLHILFYISFLLIFIMNKAAIVVHIRFTLNTNTFKYLPSFFSLCACFVFGGGGLRVLMKKQKYSTKGGRRDQRDHIIWWKKNRKIHLKAAEKIISFNLYIRSEQELLVMMHATYE